MATNELPEKPSDEQMKDVRRFAEDTDTMHGVSRTALFAVLRYLLAQHDAKPAPVAVPEDVVAWAKRLKGLPGPRIASDMAADWILSLVPEPVVEWREGLTGDKNTAWQLYVNGDYRTEVGHCLRHDAPAWRLETGFVGERAVEFYSKLNYAKSRAEELCSVSTKKGG